MNEKHYDNLCEIAENLGVDAIEFAIKLQGFSLPNILNASREETIEVIATTYNLLDMLCIAFDCEDEVQDMAERIAADDLSSEA